MGSERLGPHFAADLREMERLQPRLFEPLRGVSRVQRNKHGAAEIRPFERRGLRPWTFWSKPSYMREILPSYQHFPKKVAFLFGPA
jgi:hypothetical protein